MIEFLNLYKKYSESPEKENGLFFSIKDKQESINLDAEDDIISFN